MLHKHSSIGDTFNLYKNEEGFLHIKVMKENVFWFWIFHYHNTFASFCNFYNNSSISLTIIPAFFFGGSVVSIIFTLLLPIFKELKSTYSIGAFLAFIIIDNDAIFGVFNLKSHVITAGAFIDIVYKPVSTYLVTSTSSFFT